MVIRVPQSKTRFLARIDNYPLQSGPFRVLRCGIPHQRQSRSSMCNQASVQIDPQPLLEATSQSVVLVGTCSSQAASDLTSNLQVINMGGGHSPGTPLCGESSRTQPGSQLRGSSISSFCCQSYSSRLLQRPINTRGSPYPKPSASHIRFIVERQISESLPFGRRRMVPALPPELLPVERVQLGLAFGPAAVRPPSSWSKHQPELSRPSHLGGHHQFLEP